MQAECSKQYILRIMIYKITFSCDEVDDFRRVFEADSEATFLELHQAILKSVGYPDDQMTSFYMCNDYWEKGQEVTLMEMGSNFEYDNMIMESTRLSDLLEDRGQRMIYVFDPMYERCFSVRQMKHGIFPVLLLALRKFSTGEKYHTQHLNVILIYVSVDIYFHCINLS